MANHVKFREGMEVEVLREEPELEGFWYPAKILDAPPEQDRVYVQYDTLMSEADESKQPKAFVKLSNVRLRPPEEDYMNFEPGDRVEALFEAGWLEGTIKEAVEVGESEKFIVFFWSMQKEVEFEKMNLRHSGNWIEGEWIPKILQVFRGSSEMKFPNGMLVEVSGDEEGFFGAWFTATIVNASGADSFVVEYLHLKTDDGTELLTKTVDSEHIRPFPPEVSVETFSLDDEVDAWRDDGWWVGLISSVLEGPEYIVYFPNTDEKNKFEPCHLRLHQEWINNKWIHAAQD